MIEEAIDCDPMQRVRTAAEFLGKLAGTFRPRIGVVLGSGLGAVADGMITDVVVPYEEIPGFPRSTVAGHRGRCAMGLLAGVPTIVMQGRAHLYEGYAIADVVLPVRVMIELGARDLVFTNAAGGVNLDTVERPIMVIRDHINLSGANPLVGLPTDRSNARFIDMTAAYDRPLRRALHDVARELGIELSEGVYAGLLGPSYETPAEVSMLRVLGADAVGMSTVNEVIAARQMGARVVGISCISNMAAGLSGGPLSHDEVQTTAKSLEGDLARLIEGLVARMGLPTSDRALIGQPGFEEP